MSHVNVPVSIIADDLTIGDQLTLSNSTDQEGQIVINAGASGEDALVINNASTEILAVDADATTTALFTFTDSNTLTTGTFVSISSNSTDTSTRSILSVINDNTAATGATVANFRQDADQRCLLIDQNGNATSLFIDSEATTDEVLHIDDPKNTSATVFSIENCDTLTTRGVFRIHSNSSDTNTRSVSRITNDHVDATGATVLTLDQDAAQRALFIDMNGATGDAIQIDQDSNSASDVYAMTITSDNAGAGNPGGIDVSNFSVDEPLLKCPVDAITTTGTVSQQIAIDIGGTTYYLVAYTHGS